jgi:cysteine desulfurase
MIYADNNATTAVAPEVMRSMTPYFVSDFYNPSSAYDSAKPISDAVEAARRSVAKLVGDVEPSQVIFTSGATESNNAALRGALMAMPSRRHIITTQVEHPSVLEVCRLLEQYECVVTYLGVDSRGLLDPEDLVSAMTPQTLMVSIMHANNETGVILPIDKLAQCVKQRDQTVLFHTDATQSVGKIRIDLCETLRGVDFLSLSGHKLHGPKGVGALFIRESAPWRTFVVGGHQEAGRRGGSSNVPGIVGLGKACELAQDSPNWGEPIRLLRDKLQEGLSDLIPRMRVNGIEANRLPNTLNLSFEGIEGDALLAQLHRHGICVSTGSACTTGSLDPSHVLRAMRVPENIIHGSIRISFSKYTTQSDTDLITEVLPRVVERLRGLSPSDRGDSANRTQGVTSEGIDECD